MITEYVQPILIALAVLLIPACVKLGVNAIKTKLDEGRMIAEESRAEVKRELEEKHLVNTRKLDEIESQVKITNSTVKDHTIQLARIEGAVFGSSALTQGDKHP